MREYTQGDYNITQYNSGGSVRDRLTNKIVASYTIYWTRDGSVHEETQKEIDYINKKLGIKIEIL
jgi:hypothetical protein